MIDTYQFGEMKISWLDGGAMVTDGGTLFGPVPKAVWNRFFPCDETNRIPSHVAPILIQYQEKNYLIDTSFGPDKLNDKAIRNMGIVSKGNLVGSLAECGLQPEDIDVIMMTHMHNDHAGGLTYLKEGNYASTFPHAVIYVQEKEWDDVRTPTNRTKGTYLRYNWEPIQDQVKTFSETLEVAPGITMIHTGGHSRGHSIIRLEQHDKTIVHLADILLTHVHVNPLWVGAVDDYPMDSIKAKEKWMAEALENQYSFIFYHDPFYRKLTYTKDGKAIQEVLKSTQKSPIPMAEDQDKAPSIV